MDTKSYHVREAVIVTSVGETSYSDVDLESVNGVLYVSRDGVLLGMHSVPWSVASI